MKKIAPTAILLMTIGLVVIPSAGEAVHSPEWHERTWRTDWCTLVIFGCETMDIEVRRVGNFTSVQRLRLQDGMTQVSQLPAEDYLHMRDAGSTNDIWQTCDPWAYDPDWGYNHNTVRWAGPPPQENTLGAAHVNPTGDGGICNFNVTFYDSPDSYTYNFGTNGTNSDEIHWLPIVMHEFGHGIGFGIEPAEYVHFHGTHCPPNRPEAREIMCKYLANGADYTVYGNSDRAVMGHAYS